MVSDSKIWGISSVCNMKWVHNRDETLHKLRVFFVVKLSSLVLLLKVNPTNVYGLTQWTWEGVSLSLLEVLGWGWPLFGVWCIPLFMTFVAGMSICRGETWIARTWKHAMLTSMHLVTLYSVSRLVVSCATSCRTVNPWGGVLGFTRKRYRHVCMRSPDNVDSLHRLPMPVFVRRYAIF